VTISQTATDVRSRARQGLIGQPTVSGPLLAFLTMLNEDPQAVQSDTVTFSGFTGPTKTITINGVDVTFVAETSVTVTAANCALAINAEPAVRGQVSASSALGVTTLAGLTPGLAYTLVDTDADAEIALANLAAATSAAAIPFGRLVLDDGGHPDGDATRLGKLAQASAFAPQAGTVTVVFFAAETYNVTIVDKATGEILASVTALADTDDTDTATAIAAALNVALPANTVIASSALGVVTLTAEVAGFEFAASGGAGNLGGTIAFADVTGPDASTSLARTAAGVSMHSIMDEAATIGALEGHYPANHGFRALSKGPIWVERDAAVSKGDAVFVELDNSGGNGGKFFAAGSATRVQLGSATWERDGRTAADDLAAIRVNF
tara:strand:+ start:957 stop:2096 length:1140 start_codon:yes stop_codon:yes gene_type:complete